MIQLTESTSRTLYIYLAQLVLGVILFFVFRNFSQVYRKKFLYTWALSWLSFSLFMFTSALPLQFSKLTELSRIIINIIAQFTCFLQVVMILRGIHEMVSERALNRRKFRQLLLFFLILAIATVVIYQQPDEISQKNFLGFASRTLTSGLGFIITAFVVWFHPKFTRGFGQGLLAVSCFIYSFYQLYFLMAAIFELVHVQILWPEFYGIADILLVALMGMSMVMWLLEDEREKLEKANVELDRFLYSTSHDLKAPIASILGLTYLGKLEFTEEKARLFMGLIEDRIKKLDAVITDFLSLSKTKKFDIKLEPINLHELVEDVVADLKFNQNASAITLDYQPDRSHVFTSDYSQMKIVMRNLIGNAVKYHNLNQERPFVKVVFNRLEDYVEISVSDNGQGIAPESLPKIFEMFFRASTSSEGTGLGLYIVNEALKRVKGTIAVESVLGAGTTFTVQLEDA